MYDFSQPQRQSIKGIAIMFADTLQGIIRGLWAPILLIIYKFDWSKMYFLIFGFFLLLLLIGVVAYLKYMNFTFFLNEEKQEFVIQKGVITKNNITIQLDKIQQVNINQSVVQKLVGVFSVDIDTAGGNKKEASIRAVDNAVALHLKNKLLSYETNAKTNFCP
ncbi:PH domain-containing protein [Flavobacterium piscinae]|uniref:PH domain-containing protein n=1 Tax=Flavobacterium piscinae TaxID=2506424 RepID=UPI0019C9107A|nr:PH domain-containing protein [Flavobacterium piscinae]MBC8883128.1 PH domain-containing protein [Flavobacterium piscinae]